jgi:hypothetical protein
MTIVKKKGAALLSIGRILTCLGDSVSWRMEKFGNTVKNGKAHITVRLS